MVDEQVDQLLRDSMAAHRIALVMRQRKSADAPAKLTEAATLRRQAIELDPSHDSTAWADEITRLGRDLHAELMAFYEKQGA